MRNLYALKMIQKIKIVNLWKKNSLHDHWLIFHCSTRKIFPSGQKVYPSLVSLHSAHNFDSSIFCLFSFVQWMQGEKDWEKYEVARKLKSCVDDIRNQYLRDLKSREMCERQRAVALYFIDKVWFEAFSWIFAVSRIFIIVYTELPEMN